jgi:hypothetical protein
MLKALALIAAFTFPVLMLSAPAEAAKKHKRNLERPQASGLRVRPAFQQSPARMIEVRPGQWISSWGCYTDEGYGRIGTCDRREGPN